MIHVLTYPDRWIDWIRYQIYGTMPTVSGEDMRTGPGIVEVIMGDTCTMIPIDAVVHIFWDSGYKSALVRVRQEANENATMQLQNLMAPEEEGEMPYAPPENPPSMNDYR